MKALKWMLIVLAGLIVLVALFYAEEDWRGKRAWEKCKAEFEAKGEVLDWNKYIPPPVPDDQNFFKAPKMTEWFVKPKQYSSTNELTSRMTDPRTSLVGAETNSIVTEADARSYLAWSDQFEPDFDLIREALKRPYARMDGDYSSPREIPIPNFVAIRVVSQLLAQRAHCYFLLGQPDKALRELTLLNDSRRLLEGASTGQPMTLVAAMIDVAVAGLYAHTVAEGFQRQVWQEPQLVELLRRLSGINLLPTVTKGFESERAALCRIFETAAVGQYEREFVDIHGTSPSQKFKDPLFVFFTFAPHGWIDRNMTRIATLEQTSLDCIDQTNQIIFPSKLADSEREIMMEKAHLSPYNFLAAIAVANFPKASLTTAYNQTLVNETQIACALERYRLAHGEYPETLDALTPQFIEKLPHDVINGQPLHYRRTDDGKFLLYSIGWDETDDGGQVVLKEDGSVDREKGDWVWQCPAE